MIDKDISNNQGEIVIYQSENGDTKIDVRFVDETVWLTQQQMADLFNSSRSNIVEHIKHIYEEGELDEISTCRNFRQVRIEGNRQVSRDISLCSQNRLKGGGQPLAIKTKTSFLFISAILILALTSLICIP